QTNGPTFGVQQSHLKPEQFSIPNSQFSSEGEQRSQFPRVINENWELRIGQISKSAILDTKLRKVISRLTWYGAGAIAILILHSTKIPVAIAGGFPKAIRRL